MNRSLLRSLFQLTAAANTALNAKLVATLLAALAAFFTHATLAQTPPAQVWLPPRLVVATKTDVPIRVQSVRISAEIRGRQAWTEIDMTFFNPNRRVLEGELQFPLLDGQQIAGFAMDVNGVLRDAVPVEKARGQAVFEDIVRTNVDPGLLEATQGNNFKLRVYPIPANGIKRVVLRVAESLNERAGRGQYRLPLGFGERIGKLVIDVSVAGSGHRPDAHSAAIGDLIFAPADGNPSGSRHGNSYRLHVERNDFTVAELATLNIGVPVGRETVVGTQVFDGRTYFMADVALPGLAVRELPRQIPSVIGIVWDASGSGADRNHAREFMLLDAYFRRMRNGEVRLTRLRHAADPVDVYQVRDGNWSTLRKALLATAYDGATNFGAFVADRSVREYLLFSDGLSTFGDTPFTRSSAPLFAVNAALKSDSNFLRHIAERSGGRLIDLTLEAPDAAARQLLNSATQVAAGDAAGISGLQLASPFPQGGRILLAGMFDGTSTVIPLAIEQPGAKRMVMQIPINARAHGGVIAAGQWARLRLAELESEYALNRAEIRRLGQRFSLVTRETSLIVLDRVEDYARFEIAPPAELRADYERIIATVATQRRAEKSAHLEQIVRLFEEKVRWWNRDFPKGHPPVKEVKIASADSIAATGSLGRSNAPQAPQSARRAEARREMAQDSGVRTLSEQNALNRTAAGPPALAATAKMAGPAASAPAATTAVIRLQKWLPDSPGMARMRDADADDRYRVYLDEKPGNSSSTAFFLDAADVFIDKGQSDLGIRILTNLAEMDLENRHILRVLGYRLMQAKEPALAIPVLRKVLALSPDEPQSYRDLGLAYAAARQSQKAIDTLYEVVIRPWHGRFPEVELITLAELNAIVATATTSATSSTPLDVSRMDARLVKNLPVDLRAVLTWDADNTDIDLWVTDPNGERAFYGNRLTYQGGRMSQDFTGGYGPEEFSLKSAKPGKYKVEAQYFGDRRQNVTGATTLQVRLTTHFGMPGQQDQLVTMRLKGTRDVMFVGEFEIK